MFPVEAPVGMKVVISSDSHTPLVPYVISEVERRGHDATYVGPPEGEERDWTEVTLSAARAVAGGQADEAIVMCWTGTGAVLAANKVRGIRAALCADAATARGARIWNHANVLGLSLRATSLPLAGEILDAWYNTPFSTDDWNRKQMERLATAEQQFGILEEVSVGG